MSLVGSLEDLALGDILQIVSLARKSGLLLLRSESGDGRIVFRDGLVQAAFVKGEPEDLAGVLRASGMADPELVARALDEAEASGRPRAEVLAERAGISPERLDSLRREHVERVVVRMFGWDVGEFSFDVRDQIDARDRELVLATGINAQFLSMEAARLGDEEEESVLSTLAPMNDFVFSGEAADGGDTEPEVIPLSPMEDFVLSGEAADGGDTEPEVLPLPEPGAPPGPAEDAAPEEASSVPLVVIDGELRALEWIKSVVRGHFQRVHIFQHAEGGIGRVRQYLMRGQLPTVLVSSDVSTDARSDAQDATELLLRLRAQAPRMPILVLHQGEEPEAPGVAAADGLIARPPSAVLLDRRRRAEVEEAGDSLLAALAPWSRGDASPDLRPRRATARRAADEAALERLREISDRLRDPATLGDVLSLVIEFAAESFQRVAMFMVRDDEAVGMAQRGLEAAGGPDEAGFRRVRVPLDEPACFQEVVASRRPHRLVPDDDGDRQLTGRLGDSHPAEIYVGPIESGGRVAAILYADNLPGSRRMRDPAALAVVLHEAGLALDRALLERALAEAEGTEAVG